MMGFDYKKEFGDFNIAKVNIYLLRNDRRAKGKSYAELLPADGLNSKMLESYGKYLYGYKEREIVPFNPTGNTACSIETIGLLKVREEYDKITAIVQSAKDYNKKSVNDKNDATLTYVEMEIEGVVIIFITQYRSAELSFKHKNVFFRGDGRFEQQDMGNLLALNYNIDVAIVNDIVYIFNKAKFMEIFKYDAHMKKTANELCKEMGEWKFLSSSENFIKFAANGYFYKGISKISDDIEYLALFKTLDAKIIKERILSKSSKYFNEEDFDDNNCLIVTKSNCENTIKLITKGFKYNLFTDKTET